MLPYEIAIGFAKHTVCAVIIHADSNFPCNFTSFEMPTTSDGAWLVKFRFSIRFEN